MSDEQENNKKSRGAGIIGLSCAVVVYLGFMIVASLIMTDIYIFWNWYLLIIGAVCIIGMAIVTFLLKGTIGMIVNAALFVAVLVIVFLEYWLSTTRVLVLGSVAEAGSDLGSGDAAVAAELFKISPRTVFVFAGKSTNAQPPENKTAPKMDKKVIKDAIEATLAKEKDFKNKTFSLKLDSKGAYANSADSAAVVSAVNGTKFSKRGQQYMVSFADELKYSDAFLKEKGPGMKVEDFKAKYAKKKK